MKNRNRNVDILRALALILVVVYHAWTLSGQIPFRLPIVTLMVSLGGEIGVTAFFALSGYGIFCSLARMEQTQEISFFMFMKRRLIRILPAYYVSFALVLFFMDGANYLSRDNLWNVILHMLLIHNLNPVSFGTINGVLWTMGVIFQFYIIAIPLYKVIQKTGIFGFVGTVIFTILCKYAALTYLLPALSLQGNEFFLGRQLFTALDNFTVGMIVAYIMQKREAKWNQLLAVVGTVASCGLLIVVSKLGIIYGIHSANISGCTWHSAVAICLGLITICFARVQIEYKDIISKVLLWIAKYEYGIYLVHLVFIMNMLNHAPVITNLLAGGHIKVVYLILLIISIFIGFIFNKMVDTAWKDFEVLWRKQKMKSA